MEVFTLNRNFLQLNTIDVFHSIIWTEKYYGDSEVELSVPLTEEMLQLLIPGVFLGIDKSDEIMMLESMTIKDETMKFKGISLLSWLNNRFVRISPLHKVVSWDIYEPNGGTPGWVLWAIIYNMCHPNSPYLAVGSTAIGIPNPERLAIPGLTYKDHDKSGIPIKIAVAYEPVYDAMKKIAEAYEIGMQLTLESATDTSYSLGFRSYKGLDRTSNQTVNPVVRFSPQMDSLTQIEEIQSIAELKTLVYVFAPQVDDADEEGKPPKPPITSTAGEAKLTGAQYTGFDLRALQVLGDITKEMITPPYTPPAPVPPPDTAKLLDLLNTQAAIDLMANAFKAAVDGEIVPEMQFQYGVDYNLGDIIEIQGNSNMISAGRVTEYIRSQDEAGERSYPTITMLDR